jgi:hypothetical protein
MLELFTVAAINQSDDASIFAGLLDYEPAPSFDHQTYG